MYKWLKFQLEIESKNMLRTVDPYCILSDKLIPDILFPKIF